MTTAAPVQKPLITKTGQSTPKFQPVVIQYKKDTDEPGDKTSPETKTRPRVVKNR
jgi:hypothetical protein